WTGSARAPCVPGLSSPLTLRKMAAVKSAPARLAPVKSVSMNFEPLKSAPARLAPRRSVPLNSAPLSLVPVRLAPERSEKLKSAREKSDPERSAPLRLAETIFARISPIDWFFMSAAPSIFVSTACSRLALLRSPIRRAPERFAPFRRSEEHTSELQSRENLVCRLLLEKKKKKKKTNKINQKNSYN